MASSVFADSPVSTNDSRMCGESQSDLVVVYGKKGVNVDSNGLDNLLEDRNISSVSVVRLTSPTPSMKDEEEQHEDEGIGGDDSDLLATLDSKNADKEEPEIVGLTIEEFYPRDEAKKLAKEILNYAGVANPLQIKIDYEFQRFVIQNDHCYTPLTSPSQSKPKPLADGSTSSDSKTSTTRQPGAVNRIRKGTETSVDSEEKKNESAEDDDEYSDYSDSSLSDSDNDRDSDLDFSVNDRGRKRKASTKKTRKSINKTPRKQRHSLTEKDSHGDEEQKKAPVPVRGGNRQSMSMQVGIKAVQKALGPTKTMTKPVQRLLNSTETDKGQANEQRVRTLQQTPIQKALQQQQHIQQRQLQIQMQIQQQQHLIQQQIQQQQQQQQLQQEAPKPQAQKVYLFKKDVTATMRTANGPAKEVDSVILNHSNTTAQKQTAKVDSAHETKIQTVVTLAEQQGNMGSQFSNNLPAKGFMPLVVETAAKNQLPAQISIQTHTSSAELAIENDKQLDLIDSIVKDEMQKTNMVVKHTPEPNQDIPQIVKMLESTETAILHKKPIEVSAVPTTSAASSSFTHPVEHFDIANADLLDNPDDDLYKDLLQHVAELRNDKQLQEVIEKQGYDVATSSPLSVAETSGLVALSHTSQLQQSQVTQAGVNIESHPPIAKKDPIKIIRGDGRVITLPPIEAPTTRAKRRAQSQYSSGSSSPANVTKTAAIKAEAAQRRESGERAAAASRKRTSVSSQSTNKDDEMETEDSQEDEDSEDDPNKLWCICRQPHNNRFMICCDKCEDWFHGTCVNITKAMGRDMENSGKEWTCPNCVKEKKKPVQKKITEIFDKKPTGPSTTPKIKSEPRKSIPNTSRRSAVKKNHDETSVKGLPGEMGQRKITDALKMNKGVIGPPPLVKSVEVIVTETKVNENQTRANTDGVQGKADPSPSQKPRIIDASLRSCIVCRKASRPNSIYCSDDCIRRHAQNALITVNKAAKAAAAAASTPPVPLTPEEKKKKMPSSFEEALARASEPPLQVKNKLERVYVFERKTGRILTGTNAPTTANLKKWLQENPTFEVVQPGSPESLAIERSKQKHMKIGPLNVSASNTSASTSSSSTPATPPPPLKKITEPKFELKPELNAKMQKAPVLEAINRMQKSQTIEISTRVQKPQTVDAATRVQKPQMGDAATRVQKPQTVEIANRVQKPQNFELIQRISKTTLPDTSNRTTPTTQPLKKYPQQVSIKPPNTQSTNEAKTPAKTPRKQQNPTPEQKTSQTPENSTKTDNEPIRLNVRKTLKEQLLARMNEMKLPEASRLSVSDVENFATEVEHEMFMLFNKDTGAKYKAKYRSLMFNIKDRKNQTLFQKILERKIEPRQLVRMSPEQMASQELAQWRQNENKHQLEMIKKSELDLLSCAKNYVLKTHKGEEVIESKSTDRLSLDLAIPVEDVVTVLNNSTVSSTSEADLLSPGKESIRTQSLSDLSQDADSSYTAGADSSKVGMATTSKAKKKTKKNEKDRDRHNRPKEKHKSAKKRSRSRSRSRERRHKSPYREDRHRSPNRDDKHRSPSRDEKHRSPNRDDRHRSPNRDDRHRDDRERSPHRTDRHRSPHRDNSGDDKSDHSFKLTSHKKDDQQNENSTEKNCDLKPKGVSKYSVKPKEKDTKPKAEEATQNYNLIDKIIESAKSMEEAANLGGEKEKSESKPQSASSSSAVSTTSAATTLTTTASTAENSSGGDSDQEPTSTVNIPQRPEDQYKKYVSDLPSIIWSGSINMIDVATFQIVIQPVSGLTLDLDKQLPVELDVVGRISPDTVWDYIGKIKKSPNKEIAIVRLVPSCESENTAYCALYKYLNNRRRLGVVKTVSPNMKDFYILPLGAGKALPAILQPQDSVEFFEDLTRPDLLLGIIIRIMGKRSATSTGHQVPAKTARKSELASVISNTTSTVPLDESNYTPPGSPKVTVLKKAEPKSIISAARLPSKSDDSIDLSAIINPATKISKAYAGEDADEPYSPGGSSDDDTPILSKLGTSGINTSTEALTDEDLKRKMDEINRQIEARKLEIAGMLGMDQNSSSYSSSATTELKPTLANISIPSNLQQILASIKPSQDSTSASSTAPPPPSIGPILNAEDEEYVPEPASSNIYKPLPPPPLPPADLLTSASLSNISSSSRLAQLSEAELLSMVPDDVDLRTESLKTGGDCNRTDSPSISEPPPSKRGRWLSEPPPPGLEEEFI